MTINGIKNTQEDDVCNKEGYVEVKMTAKGNKNGGYMNLDIYDLSDNLIEEWKVNFAMMAITYETSVCLKVGSYKFKSTEKDTKIALNLFIGDKNIYSGTITFMDDFIETISICINFYIINIPNRFE